MIDVIAFDADDTLWHTEPYYREVERSLIALLAGYGISADELLTVLHRIEIDNLAFFGYGIRGFTFSMIEAAIQVTGGQVRAVDIQAIIELGRGMTRARNPPAGWRGGSAGPAFQPPAAVDHQRRYTRSGEQDPPFGVSRVFPFH